MLKQEVLDETIFNWHNQWQEMPDEEVAKWEASLPDGDKVIWQEYKASAADNEDIKYSAVKNMCYRRALDEARRMGLKPHQELVLSHNTGVLVETAKGYDAGKEMIDRWGFGQDKAADSSHPFDDESFVKDYVPNTMWDILAWRRDGDAIIAVVGDDRGWKDNWEYFIVVGWSPRHVVNENWGKSDPETRQRDFDGWSPTACLM